MTKAKYGDRRQRQRDTANDLRARIPGALGAGGLTTKQLAASLGADPDVLYRVLITLRRAGTVESKVDNHPTTTGRPGATWHLRSASPIPPRDPLLWALFGGLPA
jgi:predicted ArsR family transcriptional regulator